MRLGERMTSRNAEWSGRIVRLLDDEGDEVDQTDRPVAAVVEVDFGPQRGNYLTVDLLADPFPRVTYH